jgi:hypothetical protein
LFYEFDLDDVSPKGQPLRRMNVFVTAALADLQQQRRPLFAGMHGYTRSNSPGYGPRLGGVAVPDAEVARGRSRRGAARAAAPMSG